jgi:glycosyltransferase involved in cell wall biosynthesis
MPLTRSLERTDNDVLEVSEKDRLAKIPLVSVLMVAYNHADYIAEAIEGVVSQQCDFPFELVIGEDNSQDETRNIVMNYQLRYPAIIRVVYSARNVGAGANFQRIVSKARGEYVAFCDGDDHWCASHKLAAEVELIRNNPEVGVVHTDWVRSHIVGSSWVVSWKKYVHRRVPKRLLEGDVFRTFHYPKILRSCTVLFRRSIVLECAASELGRKKYKFGDAVLAAYTTSRWKVAYLPEVTAVYRESPNSALRSGKQARLDFLKSSLEFDTDARHFFADRAGYPKVRRQRHYAPGRSTYQTSIG